jgi:hypothetical protein
MLEFLLSILCVFLPFVYMKIGPGGYAYYGPTVPDIYILGGYILGKDVSWWGISFAYKFQLFFIAIYALMAWLSYKNFSSFKLVAIFQFACFILLCCFVPWIYVYQGHVQNNSDGADLTVYPHIGWVVYMGLLYLQMRIFRQLWLTQKQHGI